MWRLLSHLVLLATASASLVISEVADKGAADACDGEEWIELHNAGVTAAELAGLILHDDKGASDEDALALGGSGCVASLGAGEYLLLCRKAECGFDFKIGGGDGALGVAAQEGPRAAGRRPRGLNGRT